MMKETTFKVSDIHCGGCGNAISTALRQHGSVEKVDVDVAEKLVHVVYDENLADDQTLAKRISDIGYTPTKA